MADYRELLRRAIEASPENTGAVRRQVYEKARSALVTQLRAINPPLAAREITQHRLQLEDCIREVEQQATEVLLGSLKSQEDVEAPVVEPDTSSRSVLDSLATSASAPTDESADASSESGFEAIAEAMSSQNVTRDESAGEQDEAGNNQPGGSIENELDAHTGSNDSIQDELQALIVEAEAEAAELETAADLDENVRSSEISTGVERAEFGVADHSLAGQSSGNFDADQDPGSRFDLSPKAGSIEYIIAEAQAAAERAAIPTRWKNDAIETVMAGADVLEKERPEVVVSSNGAVDEASEVATADVIAGPAMSSVREVEVDVAVQAPAVRSNLNDPQVAIDRAIEALDREARSEGLEENEGNDTSGTDGTDAAEAILRESNLDAVDERDAGNALTIFLILFVLLLAGVGGAGYWAWREGYIDLDTMFGQASVVEEAVAPSALTPVADEVAVAIETGDLVTGPGNTTATPEAVETASEELGKSEERLGSEANTAELALVEQPLVTPVEEITAAPGQPAVDVSPSQDRLTPDQPATLSGDGVQVAGDQNASEAIVAPIGSQSLLLEASSEGTTGAVPFSGTVDWSRGADELGQPTLLAKANIPARNLGVELLIRRNSDPGLPASHLMEVNFVASETFAGGSIAGLPGVLLKNEELVQGTPLVGASARVIGNSFLFALSAAEQDLAANTELLRTRKWIDLAMVYATGKRAIITLEKDAAAQTMFGEVLAIWAAADAAAREASPAQ